ncbi:MAG: hypothetical protein IKG79_08785 [Neisseriaceae bacterium]|nr:hypothetical protein [Neisseriaceae bacterium]
MTVVFFRLPETYIVIESEAISQKFDRIFGLAYADTTAMHNIFQAA